MGASALIVLLKASLQIVSQAGIDLIWMGTTSQTIDIMELIHVGKCGGGSLAASFNRDIQGLASRSLAASFNQESTFALKYRVSGGQPTLFAALRAKVGGGGENRTPVRIRVTTASTRVSDQ